MDIEHPTHKDYLRTVREEIAAVAKQILEGQIGILEASKVLAPLLRELQLDRKDPDLLAMIVIGSEIDHLPIGRERENWSADALASKQPEIESCLKRKN